MYPNDSGAPNQHVLNKVEGAQLDAEMLESAANVTQAPIDYFGFDLGDGECAVAWFRSDTQTEPQMLEIRGYKSVISALAVLSNGECLIGEEACQAAEPESLQLRFKSRYLKDKAVSADAITRFARTVLRELIETGRVRDIHAAQFAIGCPSGWSDRVRAEYARLFHAAGFENVRIISESRAAFLYSRESGELRLSSELLGKPTLIIDAGSSTTDFTFVLNLSEQRISARDFGDTALGGGLIEQALLELNMGRSPNCAQLRELMRDYPQCYARCEMEARKVKEMYFTRQRLGGSQATLPCESSLKLYCAVPPVTLDISCADADMNALLAQPLKALNARSFMDAYASYLGEAKRTLRDQPPQIVLMTGGASRMRFMRELAQQTFPDAMLVQGIEPEFAIARGLSYALRLDARAAGFEREVRRMIESEAVEDVIHAHLASLFCEIALPISSAVIEKIADPAFASWRVGAIATIDGIAESIRTGSAEFFKSDDMRRLLEPYMVKWLRELRPKLEQVTDPICDKYELPRTALRIGSGLQIKPGGISIGSEHLINLDGLKVMMDVVITTLFATILGGAETALMMAGPAGIIIGGVIGLIVAMVGTEAADRKLRKVNIPLSLRKLYTPRRFHNRLAHKQHEFADAIRDELLNDLNAHTPEMVAMTNDIAACIEAQLNQMLEQALLLIH